MYASFVHGHIYTWYIFFPHWSDIYVGEMLQANWPSKATCLGPHRSSDHSASFQLCQDKTRTEAQRVWGKSSHYNWPSATINATRSSGKAQGSNYITNKACLKLWINQTAENKTFLSGTSDKRNENNRVGWVMKSQHSEYGTKGSGTIGCWTKAIK